MIYITGDTHAEPGRFMYEQSPLNKLTNEDKIIVAGDFGYIFHDNESERKFLDYMAERD